jgi:hypothetical protein
MKNTDLRFPAYAHFYVWLFVCALCSSPLFIAYMLSKHQELTLFSWGVAGIASFGILALFGYANIKCSSEQLNYQDGLLFVACSMMTGWTYLSIVIVVPSLLITFVASVLFALYADLSRSPSKAAALFHRLVTVFYRNRMHQ